MIQSLQQKVAPRLKFIHHFAAIFFYYIIKTTPSDAKSREEQDGSKQKFVGRMMAKLWPDLR